MCSANMLCTGAELHWADNSGERLEISFKVFIQLHILYFSGSLQPLFCTLGSTVSKECNSISDLVSNTSTSALLQVLQTSSDVQYATKVLEMLVVQLLHPWVSH